PGVHRLAATGAILDAEHDRAPVTVHLQQIVAGDHVVTGLDHADRARGELEDGTEVVVALHGAHERLADGRDALDRSAVPPEEVGRVDTEEAPGAGDRLERATPRALG